VIRAFKGGNDSTGKGVLDKLQSVKGGVRKIVEEGVAIIEFGMNEGIGKEDSRIDVKRGSDLTKLPNVEEG